MLNSMKFVIVTTPWHQGFGAGLFRGGSGNFFPEQVPAPAPAHFLKCSNLFKITSTGTVPGNTCIHIPVYSSRYLLVYFFTLENISKEVMYHTICVNYESTILAGTGAGPKWRLRLQPNIPVPGGSVSKTWPATKKYFARYRLNKIGQYKLQQVDPDPNFFQLIVWIRIHPNNNRKKTRLTVWRRTIILFLKMNFFKEYINRNFRSLRICDAMVSWYR